MSRILAREYCFKLAFEYQFLLSQDQEYLTEIFEDDKLDEIDKDYIAKNYEGMVNKLSEIDDIIRQYLKGYTLERLFKIDLAILRVAIYEMKYSSAKTPESVVIDSAVELAKKYSTDNGYKFINGILASIVRSGNDSKATN